MQHVQIPNIMATKTESVFTEANESERTLKKGDKVVYAAIRRNMNAETRSCFPSIHTIKALSGCGQAKVTQAIKRLEKAGFLTIGAQITPAGRVCNLYTFPETSFDKSFEMFTYEFLDMDLPTNVKEYYMDVQHYFLDDGSKEKGVGRCNYSNAEIARRTGWSIPTVKKNNALLIEKGLLTEEVLPEKDQAGLPIVQKQFDLDGLHQAALWAKAVTEQITKNTADIENVQQEQDKTNKRVELLEEQIAKLKEQIAKKEALERNKVVDAVYPME